MGNQASSDPSLGTSSAWNDYDQSQSSYSHERPSQTVGQTVGQGVPYYPPERQNYPPPPPPVVPAERQNYPPPPPSPHEVVTAYPPPQPHQSYGGPAPTGAKKFDRRYSRIADNFNSLDEVTSALARAGLESSNLILGIDFTKSNEWTGKKSFHGKSLHHIGHEQNPYEQAITIIGKTLAAFDEDNLIPCFGFGDASTHDQDVFSFYPNETYCQGFEQVLSRYREITPHIKLAGPTSFAPVIEMAMTIVEQSGGQYHVLVIIADGQVTRSVDTEHGRLSPQEQKTVDAIVKASKYPLSIILVGVGDGPWDTMKEFDDNIPARDFDNFQFVNFTGIMSKNVAQSRKETEFALTALMEIPTQYKATIEFNLLGGRKGNAPERVPLPPPVYAATSTSFGGPGPTKPYPSAPSSFYEPGPTKSDPSAPSSFYENQLCPICLTNSKDMAFGCGHQTCCDCGRELKLCPICRSTIQTRIKLY